MLKSVRPTIACLTLATLLLSNFAGWVHVGCQQAESRCCFGSAGSCQRTDQHSKADRDRSQSTHVCCHHDHRLAEPHDGDAGQHHDGGSDDSEQSAPVHPHDSDRCSVCQGFYTCRLGTVLACDAVIVELTRVDSTPICPAPIWSGDSLYSSISVRGPPRV